jgi:hypothetical protein
MNISSIPSSSNAITPRVKQPDAEEFARLKKEPTKVITKGDIYTSTAVHFKELTLEELKYEKIDVDKSKYTYVSHTDGPKNEPDRIVTVRDPANNNKYVTMQLSKASIDQLKQKFGGVNDFFERGDGTLRLNGEAEAFVAGWLQNITTDRSYTKSDADGNGFIEGDEAKTLTIGFERHNNYDYIGKKVVKINLDTGAKYKELGRAAPDLFKGKEAKLDFQVKRSATDANYIQFENSVEKELDHTIQMDVDMNGTVTLKEGLSDEFGKDYQQKVISEMDESHQKFLNMNPNFNDSTQLQNHDYGLSKILSEDEVKQIPPLPSLPLDALQISTSDFLTFALQKDKTISDTLDQLQIQNKSEKAYSNEDENTVLKEKEIMV